MPPFPRVASTGGRVTATVVPTRRRAAGRPVYRTVTRRAPAPTPQWRIQRQRQVVAQAKALQRRQDAYRARKRAETRAAYAARGRANTRRAYREGRGLGQVRGSANVKRVQRHAFPVATLNAGIATGSVLEAAGGLASLMGKAAVAAPRVLDRELSGQGVIAEGAGKLGSAAVAGKLVPSFLRGQLGRDVLGTVSPVIGAIDRVPGGAGVLKRAGKEAFDIPAQLPAGFYVPGKMLWGGDVEGAAREFSDPIVEVARNPIKSLEERPLSTLLIGAGALRGGSRAAGTAFRAGAAGRWGKEYASAAPVRMEPTPGFVIEQPLPRGLVENRLAKRRLRSPARAAAVANRQAGRRIDFTTDRAIVANRMQREETGRVVGRTPVAGGVRGLVRGEPGRPARLNVPARAANARTRRVLDRTSTGRLILEAQVRPGRVVEDLTALRDRAVGETPGLRARGESEKVEMNLDLIRRVDEALADPKALRRVEERGFQAMYPQAEFIRAQDQRQVQEGVLPAHRLKAQYVPPLVTFAGARSGQGTRVATERGVQEAALRGELAEAQRATGRARGERVAAERRAAFTRGEVVGRQAEGEVRVLRDDPGYLEAAQRLRAAQGRVRAARTQQRASGAPSGRLRDAEAELGAAREGFRAARVEALRGEAEDAGVRRLEDAAAAAPARGRAKRDADAELIATRARVPADARSPQARKLREGYDRVRELHERVRDVEIELASAARAERPAAKASARRESVEPRPAPGMVSSYRKRAEAEHVAQRAADKTGKPHAVRQSNRGLFYVKEATSYDKGRGRGNIVSPGEGRLLSAPVAAAKRGDEMLASPEGLRREADAARAERDRAVDEVKRLEKELPKRGSLQAAVSQVEARHRVQVAREMEGRARREERAVRDALREFNRENKGRARAFQPWMLDKEGRPISEGRAVDMLRDAGVDLQALAFVSQRLGQSSGSAYYRGELKSRQERANKEQRTGALTLQAAVDISDEAMIDDAFRRGSIVQIARHSAEMVRSLSFGDFDTYGEAQKAARMMATDVNGKKLPGAVELVPVDIAPFLTRAADVGRTREVLGLKEMAPELLGDWQKVFGGEFRSTGQGRWALMPKAAVDRLEKHTKLQNPDDAVKVLQGVTGQFRQVVLLTSSRWLFGNVAEMIFRVGLIEGAGPRAWLTGRKLMRTAERLDPEQAAMLRAGTTAFGAQYGAQARHSIRRADSSLYDSRAVGAAAGAVGKTAGAPGVRHSVGLAWRGWREAVGGLNTWMERQGDLAIMGKQARRDWRDHTQSWMRAARLGEGAYEDLARGLFNTPRQQRYAQEIDKVRGQYSRFSPSMRRIIQNYAPFVAWYVNALKFIYLTLPGRHPVKTALLAGLYQGQEDRLTEEGQSIFSNKMPGFLIGTADTGDGRLPIGRYLPFSAVPGTSNLKSFILPQLSWLGIAGGVDWKGDGIRRADGSTPTMFDLWGEAMYSFAESVIPGVAIVRRVRESGNSSAAGSRFWDPKVKEGEVDSDLNAGLAKVFNPLNKYKEKGAGEGSELDKQLDKALDEALGRGGEGEAGGVDDATLDKALDEALGK